MDSTTISLLLREEHHREVVDGLYLAVQPHLNSYRAQFEPGCRPAQELQKPAKKRRKNFLEKQGTLPVSAQRTEDVQPDPHEYAELESEIRLLDNAEELDQKAGRSG